MMNVQPVSSWNGASWFESQRFECPVTGTPLRFGAAVDSDGDVLAITSTLRDVNGMPLVGSGWLYRRHGPTGRWRPDQEIVASDGLSYDIFGGAIAVLPDSVFCYSSVDTSTRFNVGALYRFDAADLTLTVQPTDPVPGATVDIELHRGVPGAPFVLVVDDISGTPLFQPILIDAFGAGHDYEIQIAAPDPALGISVGLRAWKASNIGGLAASARITVDC